MQDACAQNNQSHRLWSSGYLPIKIAIVELESNVQAAMLAHESDECAFVTVPAASFDPNVADRETVLPNLDAVVTSSPDVLERLKAFYADPSAGYGGLVPVVSLITTPGAAATFILGRLGACVRRLSRSNVDLLRSTALLRADYEATVASFAALETLVQDQSLLGRQAGLPIGPARLSHPAESLSVTTFEQLLPDRSAGLCDVAIYLRSLPEGEGDLQIQLRALESGSVVGRWIVARRALSQGWLRLSLDKALPVEPSTLLLSGRWTGGEGLNLGIGVSHPVERWQASINGQRIGTTLALNRWTASPGLRLAHASDAIRPLESGLERSTLALQAGMTIVDSLSDPSMIFLQDEQKSIQVHPVGLSPTKACLPLACPAGVVRISARIETLHPEAGRIFYAIGLGSPASRGAIAQPSLDLDHQSDWLVLPARTPAMITLFLAAPLTEPADLYLMTRLPEGETSRFGWAHFSEITFDYAVSDAYVG